MSSAYGWKRVRGRRLEGKRNDHPFRVFPCIFWLMVHSQTAWVMYYRTLCFSHNFIQPDHGPHGNPWQMYASANFKLVVRKRKRGLSEVEGASVSYGEREKSRYWINRVLSAPVRATGIAENVETVGWGWKYIWKLWFGWGCAWRSKCIRHR